MYFNACQRSLTLRRRGLMQIRQVAGSPPENLPPRRFIRHKLPYETRTFVGLQSLKLEFIRARVALRQTAVLYRCRVFHNIPVDFPAPLYRSSRKAIKRGHCLSLSAIYLPENPSTNAVRSGMSAGSALSCPTPKSRRSCTEPPLSRRSSNSAVLVSCVAASNPETTNTSR